MPGLAGFLSLKNDALVPDLEIMLSMLRYGNATITDSYRELNYCLGCVHLGTGGQRALYQSDEAIVAFYGYLTEPAIPPGADPSDPMAKAHYIHDHYLVYGDKMMGDLAGAFAISIWDKRTQSLLLITDYLGLRPIYYSILNDVFRFASEVKGILADPKIPRIINKEAFADYFYFGHILEEKTFFENIQLVPPASILRLHDGHLRVESYSDVTFPDTYPHRTDNWYNDLINNAIQSSVKKMIRPNLKYGLSLSGGLDSRWIAAYLAKYQPDSIAFTLGIPGSDDTPIANQVAKQTGLKHYYWDLPTSYIADMGETYAYIVDGMDSLGSMGEFPLSMRVGNYVDVSVGGLLGGPAFGYYIDPLSANLRRKDVLRYLLWRTNGERLPREVIEQVFEPEFAREHGNIAIETIQKCLNEAPYKRGFNVFQYFVLKRHQHRSTNLAQLAKLPFVDIYHPLADKEVVTAATQLPARQLMVENAYRRAFVNSFPELGKLPWTYTLTSPSISVSAAVLKKITQHTLGKWLRKTPIGNHPLIRRRHYYTNHSLWSRGPVRSFIEETLLSPESNATGLFNLDGLKLVIQEHMERKRDITSFIDKVLMVALWTRLFYTPSMPIRPSSLLVDSQK